MEDEDFNTLQHPESYVIAKSGEIFFALLDQEVIGTAAMIPTSDKVFELAKMAVRKDVQGRGVGKLLLKRCISFAKERKALICALRCSGVWQVIPREEVLLLQLPVAMRRDVPLSRQSADRRRHCR